MLFHADENYLQQKASSVKRTRGMEHQQTEKKCAIKITYHRFIYRAQSGPAEVLKRIKVLLVLWLSVLRCALQIKMLFTLADFCNNHD